MQFKYIAKHTKIKCLFVRFPNKDKSPERHSKWGVVCRRAHVCSQHFAEAAIDRTGQITRLRSGAVPTIVDLPVHLQVYNPYDQLLYSMILYFLNFKELC